MTTMTPISDTAEALVVRVGDRLVEGWIAPAACAACGGPTVYVLAYDATCCPACNTWAELLCPDPECMHCRCRPQTPF
jgi:hypothetical protein